MDHDPMDKEKLQMTEPEQMRHELLIRVDEQLKAVARDVQEVKNGYGTKLALIEADIDSLKMWRWYTAGGLAVLAAVFFWLFPKFASIEESIQRAVNIGVSQSLSEYVKPQ